jgi:hypothetical protein
VVSPRINCAFTLCNPLQTVANVLELRGYNVAVSRTIDQLGLGVGLGLGL